MNDLELLRRYAEENSQEAFAELVRRHLDLVYGVALRQVRSPQLAEDVAQSVFMALARNAGKMRAGTLLPGWLYRVARHAAIDAVRGEVRRQQREQTAAELAQMKTDAPRWTTIEPVLDEALEHLEETDRNAVLLRYFEGKSLREVGQALGTSEDAAQKRVSRAVEELRAGFAKQGITVAGVTVAALLTVHATQAAPMGLGASIAGAAALESARAGGTMAVAKGIAMTTFTKIIVGAALVAVVSGGIYQAQRADSARAQVEAWQQQAKEKARADLLKHLTGPHLPAPRMTPSAPVTETPPEEDHATNLFARLMNGNVPKLTGAQIDVFLKDNKRSAGSLLAAFRESGDMALLREALEKYPNDPQVNYAAAVKTDSTPEERRQWVEAFKRAAPDNALGNYLAAFDAFKAGNADLAVQEFMAAGSKPQMQDYSRAFVQNAEEAFLSAGYPPAQAEMMATSQLLLPQLKQLKDLNNNMVDLAKSYRAAGDEASARAALQMDIQLGERFNGAPGEALISTLVGFAIQRIALNAMDPNSPYGNSGGTVANQYNQLTQKVNAIKVLDNQAEPLMQNLSDQDYINYKNRWMMFGEENAMHWLVDKFGGK